jgi:hypothetical protein
MEWAFFGVFALVAAMIFNYVQPMITAQSWAQTPGASSFIGKTLVTGLGFFVVLIAAAFLMKLVTGKREVIP